MHRLSLFCLSASIFLVFFNPSRADEGRYEVVKGWPQLPNGHELGLCAGVGVDAQNRVFVFHRSGRKWQNPFPTDPIPQATVSVFDGATGALLKSWGAGRFIMPHGLSVDSKGQIWLTDVGLHQVFQCTPDGEILRSWGEAGVPGADAAHFDRPTDVAVLPDGSFYVSDGYRNTRVMKFSREGKFEFEWGDKGSGSGEFNLPHGIALDKNGRVLVCDRENLRVQVFDPTGQFVAAWKGPEVGKPFGIATAPDGQVFVMDGGLPSLKASARGKVTVMDAKGQMLGSFGGAGALPGQFQLGHDIAVGPDGAIYTAEGTGARVQKFVRRP